MNKSRYSFPLILLLCVLAGIGGYRLIGAKRPVAERSARDTVQNDAAPDAAGAIVSQPPQGEQRASQASSGTDALEAIAVSAPAAMAEPIPTDIPAPMNPNFRLRPFNVVKSTRTHQWTAEDCRSDAAIRELAHNALEEEQYRMANQWTTRRQLVYRHEKTGDFVAELESGARTQIVVPGFDGAEFTVDVQGVTRFNDDGFGLHGTISGHPGSTFNLGYAQGRESMTIQIPSRNLLYEINPREENEVVINQIDSVAFDRHRPPMGEPIRNDDVGHPRPSPR